MLRIGWIVLIWLGLAVLATQAQPRAAHAARDYNM
jgi:hypothetical protein